MRRPNSRWSCLVIALIGCATAPLATDLETDTGTDASATGFEAPICEPDECHAECQREYDECAQPLAGECTADGLCECVQPVACVACEERECGLGEVCSSEFGQCTPNCAVEIPPVIDPPGSCEIQFVDFAPVLEGFVYVDIDGITYPRVFDCAEELDAGTPAWRWLAVGETMLLCEQLCVLFEAATQVEIGVACESA